MSHSHNAQISRQDATRAILELKSGKRTKERCDAGETKFERKTIRTATGRTKGMGRVARERGFCR